MDGGIFIDLDGTLIDSFFPLFTAYTKFLLMQGKCASREEFEALNGIPVREMIPVLRKNHDLYINDEELEKLYHRLIGEIYSDITLMPGALSFLQAAKKRSIPLALVTSSSSEWVHPLLDRLEVSSFFPSIVTCNRVLKGKPAPDCYLLAIKELGVNPQESYAIDDAEVGIEAARQAGINPLKFVRMPPYPDHGGDWATLERRLHLGS